MTHTKSEPYYREALSANPTTHKKRLDWAIDMLFQCLTMDWKHNGLFGGETKMVDGIRNKALETLSLITGKSIEDVEDEVDERINWIIARAEGKQTGRI